jgi:hypothetical protein
MIAKECGFPPTSYKEGMTKFLCLCEEHSDAAIPFPWHPGEEYEIAKAVSRLRNDIQAFMTRSRMAQKRRQSNREEHICTHASDELCKAA